MALCRIYLCTYRRPALLPRALDSLLQQTCQDWVCELHNDDPGDTTPQELVDKINDRRITLVNHPQNLGPTQTFNQVFKPVEEPFVSLLEDDNWWNPTFLETMVQVMAQHPQVDVAWSNMRMWRENPDRSWTNLEQSTFPVPVKEAYQLFDWSHSYQILGALHSQGAMLVRTRNIENYQVPPSTPSAGIEHVRERAYRYPILFVNQELANFAVTLSTSRSRNSAEWGATQLLLAATFFKHMKLNDPVLQQIWQDFRSKKPPTTSPLLWSGLLYPECRYLLKHAVWQDWLLLILKLLKRPLSEYKCMKQAQEFQELYQFLDASVKQQVCTSTAINMKDA